MEEKVDTDVVKNEMLSWLNTLTYVSCFEENDLYIVNVNNEINFSEIRDFLQKLYEYETILTKEKANNIVLRLRDLSIDKLVEAIRFSIKREDLCDANMLLNILNLVKTYNTLEDSFFADENIFFTSVENLLDLKLEIQEDLEEIIQKLSIYFISLFKSYNKVLYSASDYHIELKPLYRNLFLSMDLITLSGIFAISKPFNTEECVYIDNALEYLFAFQQKNAISFDFLESFLQEKFKDDNKE